MKRALLSLNVLVVLAALTACSSASQHSAPEPEPSNIKNGTHTAVFQMPDGFRNVAFTCNGKTGIYVTSRGAFQNGNKDAIALPSGIAAVPNDPACG